MRTLFLALVISISSNAMIGPYGNFVIDGNWRKSFCYWDNYNVPADFDTQPYTWDNRGETTANMIRRALIMKFTHWLIRQLQNHLPQPNPGIINKVFDVPIDVTFCNNTFEYIRQAEEVFKIPARHFLESIVYFMAPEFTDKNRKDFPDWYHFTPGQLFEYRHVFDDATAIPILDAVRFSIGKLNNTPSEKAELYSFAHKAAIGSSLFMLNQRILHDWLALGKEFSDVKPKAPNRTLFRDLLLLYKSCYWKLRDAGLVGKRL